MVSGKEGREGGGRGREGERERGRERGSVKENLLPEDPLTSAGLHYPLATM